MLPTRESPLLNESVFSLLLNILKSPTERVQVVVEEAIFIQNTHVELSYVSGQFAERDVSPIFVPTVVPRFAKFPERVRRSDESEEKFEFVVAREPETAARFVLRVAIFPVAVVTSEYMLFNSEFIIAIFPEREPKIPERAS